MSKAVSKKIGLSRRKALQIGGLGAVGSLVLGKAGPFISKAEAATPTLRLSTSSTSADRRQPVLVFRQATTDRIEVPIPHEPADRADLARAHRPVVDLDDG